MALPTFYTIDQMLRDAIAERDSEQISFRANALKSSAGNIRADRLAELLSSVEEAGKRADVEGAAGLMESMTQEAYAVVGHLTGASDGMDSVVH